MPQHDYDLSNADGATFRADINAVLQAIATQNSGASNPTTTFPNMWLFRTDLDTLYQRNEANDAWIPVAKKDGSGWTPYYQGALIDAVFSKLAASNVFGASQEVNAAGPGWIAHDTGGTVDARRAIMRQISDELRFLALNDAGTAGASALALTRTANNFDLAHFRGNMRVAVGGGASDQGAGTLDVENGLFDAGVRVRPLVAGTKVNASGVLVDFFNIPTWATRVVVSMYKVSTNGSSPIIVQLGDTGGIETSGYEGGATLIQADPGFSALSSGFKVTHFTDAGSAWTGALTLTKLEAATNRWVAGSLVARDSDGLMNVGAGAKATSADMVRLRITTAGGTDSFDSGNLNIAYE